MLYLGSSPLVGQIGGQIVGLVEDGKAVEFLACSEDDPVDL